MTTLIFPFVSYSKVMTYRIPKLASKKAMNPDRLTTRKNWTSQGMIMEPKEPTPRQRLKPRLRTFEG